MDTKSPVDRNCVPFKDPTRFLGDWDISTTAKIVGHAADVALIIEGGVIRDVAIGNVELTPEGYDSSWRGKPWVETVTTESKAKINELLSASAIRPHWRQVNHPSSTGADVPIKYIAFDIGEKDRFVALGRDLRATATLQQRLIEAHQRMERDYRDQREAEARYRFLFQAIAEPVVIADAKSLAIKEANPAAADFVGVRSNALIGSCLTDHFLPTTDGLIQRCVADALANGSARSGELKARGSAPCALHLSPFQHGGDVDLIVRILRSEVPATPISADQRRMVSVVDALPDGLVVTDSNLRIVSVNAAVLQMIRVTGATPALGRQLVNFVGRSATDINVLISSIKNHGLVRNFATVLRDQVGIQEKVEISAVAAKTEDGDIFAFSVRNVTRRLNADTRIGNQLPRSSDQLTNLVGKVSLKEIVKESTVLIEKLCIEAALEITDDNRASAAEILGLSRQGLYSKLRRFGFDE